MSELSAVYVLTGAGVVSSLAAMSELSAVYVLTGAGVVSSLAHVSPGHLEKFADGWRPFHVIAPHRRPYVLAFNGVLSSTSPTVIRLLYGNYYREACKLNRVEDQCVPIVETLPWLQDHASLHKELFKDEDKGKADL
eukprot:g16126.t1